METGRNTGFPLLFKRRNWNEDSGNRCKRAAGLRCDEGAGPRKIECLGADIEEFDITDAAATTAFIERYAPDAVIHCSAYTAVDRAENDPALCERVNVDGRVILPRPVRKSVPKWFTSAPTMCSPVPASSFMKRMIRLVR